MTHPAFTYLRTVTERCDNCGGEGSHPGGKRCGRCGGTGMATRDATFEERLEHVEEFLESLPVA